MRTSLWRFASIFTLLALLASPFYLGGASFAAPISPQVPDQPPGMQIIKASYVGESQPLRSIPAKKPDPDSASFLRTQRERLIIPKTSQQSTGSFDASVVQNMSVLSSMPEPIANFEGVNNVNGVLPPDTQGDIGYDPNTGKKYYVQWVNLSFQIWDVTDPEAVVSLYGPAAGNTLWSGTGTICDYNNDGDPITLFDPLAKRWMMSQFALGFPDNFHQCIAVSATADPTGAWYLYDFLTSTTMMNDYPKFGVWPDGYYMTVNQFDGRNFSWGGAGVAVFQRDAMLLGQPALMIYYDIGQVTKDYGGMLPSDLDGPAPPYGAPNYFMEWDDSNWLGDPQDTLRIWEFRTDWQKPANSTFGQNISYDPNLLISTSNVDPNLCNGSISCIPQPDTSVGLDAIADRLMYRLQYRNFGDYEMLLTNHTVDASGSDLAGVHWFELRDDGTGWQIYQEGVYAPDSDNRWMGSLAMDDSGNIALGYSVSSSTTYPSIRYAGRLSADPLGVMAQGETSLIVGSGSQESTSSRWGDYSMMAVDPLDGCTFWYTQEYMETTSRSGWQTRIGSFKFPTCTGMPLGILTGTVTDGTNPLVGAAVTASGEYSTLTNESGVYTLELPVGLYEVTASMYGYLPATVTGIEIFESQTTTQNFSLTQAETYTVSGVVTDANTGWPLYAKIDIFGYPYTPIFTDPVSGAYEVDLAEGKYNFNIKAMSGSYSSVDAPVSVSMPVSLDFALQPDFLTCAIPGYILQPPTFREDFEVWPPPGWTIVDNIPSGGVIWDSSAVYSGGNYTGGENLAAEANSDLFQDVPYDTELISPVLDAASMTNLFLIYKANFLVYSGHERLDLDISNDGGATWKNLLRWRETHGSPYGEIGETVGIDLTADAGASFQLRWRYYTTQTAPWDYYAQIDEVMVGASCEVIPDGGLVSGGVFDANTDLPVDNPSVFDAALNLAWMVDTSADPAQPNPLYLIGAPAGEFELSARADLYSQETASVDVISGAVVRQDFYLKAGLLAVDPISLTMVSSLSAPVADETLVVNNTGGLDATYKVFALPGEWTGYTPGGPFAPNTRHIGPKNLNDLNASKLRVNMTPLDVAEIQAGALLASWDTGLDASWGIGFNHQADDLWLGNLAAGGGDDLNYRFTTAGVNTGDSIDTSPWVSLWAADMTYNPFTGMLWQVNVGGDQCVYEIDPVGMISTGRKICPPFGTSQRGLAFDPLSNTYYAGSWNDGIINHFSPDGILLDSAAVGLNISGLAFNPSSGHLFVLTNRIIEVSTFDVYVLDTSNAYTILGGFDLLDGDTNLFTDYSQAGLELDCAGNLWAVDQVANKVYVAESGETGVCDWSAEWLTVSADTGTVAAGGLQNLAVTADGSGFPEGTYQAYLRIVSNTPYADVIVPVMYYISEPIFLPLVQK